MSQGFASPIVCLWRFFPWRLAAFSLSLAAIVFACVPASTAQDTAKSRTWTDSTGKYRTEAVLVGVKNGKVYLKRTTGRVSAVPLDKLCEADREYLISVNEISAIELRRESVVAVQRETTSVGSDLSAKTLTDAYPGVLVMKDKRGGYVLGSSVLARLDTNSAGKPPKTTYRVVLNPGTEKQTFVDATLVGHDAKAGLAVWRIAAADSPIPLPFESQATPEQSQAVTILGCQIGRAIGGKPTFAGAGRQGRVTDIKKDEDSTIKSITLSGKNVTDITTGIVLDENGGVLGIICQPKYGRVPRGGASRDGEPQVEVMPLSGLAALRTPRLIHARMKAQKWGADGVEYLVGGTYTDLFGRVDQPYLVFNRGEGEPTAVKLKRANPWLEGNAGRHIEVNLPIKDTRYFSTSGPSQYTARFKYVDTDGQELFSPPLEVEPTFTDTLPESARWTLASLRGKLSPHPSGGMMVGPSDDESEADGPKVDEDSLPKIPQPRDVDFGVGGPPSKDGELTKVIVTGPELKPVRAPGEPEGYTRRVLVAGALWSQDGKYVYVLHDNGVLRKVSVPEMKESKRISLPATFYRRRNEVYSSPCLLAKEGIVILAQRGKHLERDLWVIDEDTLRVKKRIPVSGYKFTTSPTMSIAYYLGIGLAIVDLSTGKHIRYADPSRFPHSAGGGLSSIKVSNDGKYLFFAGKSVQRFRMEGTGLIFEEASKEIRAQAGVMGMIDGGSRLVVGCYPRDVKAPDHPVFPRGTYTYDIDDLSTPLKSLPIDEDDVASGRKPVAIDESTGNIYVSPSRLRDSSATIVSPDGRTLHTIPDASEHSRYYPHPGGKAFLMADDDKLFWMVLPTAGSALKSAPAKAAPLAIEFPMSDREVATRFKETFEWVKTTAPKPEPGKQPSAEETRTINGAKFTRIRLPASRPKVIGWFDGGKRLLVVSDQGRLCMLSGPQLSTGTVTSGGSAIAKECKEGIVFVHFRQDAYSPTNADSEKIPNLFVLDPKSLAVKRAFFVGGAFDLAASPNSSLCIVMTKFDLGAVTVDLAAGKLVDKVSEDEFVKRASATTIPPLVMRLMDKSLENLEMTADGEHAVAVFFRQPLTGSYATEMTSEKMRDMGFSEKDIERTQLSREAESLWPIKKHLERKMEDGMVVRFAFRGNYLVFDKHYETNTPKAVSGANNGPNGQTCAIRRGKLVVSDSEDAKISEYTLPHHLMDGTPVKISPDGKRLAFGTDSSDIWLVDLPE